MHLGLVGLFVFSRLVDVCVFSNRKPRRRSDGEKGV
jgi:hypothetical protein